MSLVTSVLSILVFTLFIMGFIGANKMALFVAYLLHIHKKVSLIGLGESPTEYGQHTLYGQITQNRTQKCYPTFLNLKNNQLGNFGLGVKIAT